MNLENAMKDKKAIKHMRYVRISRLAFWSGIFIVIPLNIDILKDKPLGVAELLMFAFYLYLAIANYVLGFRLENPPAWSKYLMPKKWINEWRQLSYGEVADSQANDKKLVRVLAVTILCTIAMGFFML